MHEHAITEPDFAYLRRTNYSKPCPPIFEKNLTNYISLRCIESLVLDHLIVIVALDTRTALNQFNN